MYHIYSAARQQLSNLRPKICKSQKKLVSSFKTSNLPTNNISFKSSPNYIRNYCSSSSSFLKQSKSRKKSSSEPSYAPPYPSSSIFSSNNTKEPQVGDLEVTEETVDFANSLSFDANISVISPANDLNLPPVLMENISGKNSGSVASTSGESSEFDNFNQLFNASFDAQYGHLLSSDSQSISNDSEKYSREVNFYNKRLREAWQKKNLEEGVQIFKRLFAFQVELPEQHSSLNKQCGIAWRYLLKLYIEKGSFEELTAFMDSYANVFGLADSDRLLCTIKHFLHQGMFEMALEFWSDASNMDILDERAYGEMAKALQKFGLNEKANSFLDEAWNRELSDPTFKVSNYLYLCAGKVYIMQKDVERLQNLFIKFDSNLLLASKTTIVKPEFYAALFNTINNAEKMASKNVIYDDAQQFHQENFVYTSEGYLDELKAAERPPEYDKNIKEQMFRIVEASMSKHEVKLTTELRNEIMAFRLHIQGDVAKMLAITTQYNAVPDQTTLNLMVEALLKNERPDTASLLIDSWNAQYGLKPDSETFSVISRAIDKYMGDEMTDLDSIFQNQNTPKKSQLCELISVDSLAVETFDLLSFQRKDISLNPKTNLNMLKFVIGLEIYKLSKSVESSSNAEQTENETTEDQWGDDDSHNQGITDVKEDPVPSEKLPKQKVKPERISFGNTIPTSVATILKRFEDKELYKLPLDPESLYLSLQELFGDGNRAIAFQLGNIATHVLPYPPIAGVISLLLCEYNADNNWNMVISFWKHSYEKGYTDTEFLPRVYSRLLVKRSPAPVQEMMQFLDLCINDKIPISLTTYQNSLRMFYLVKDQYWDPRAFWRLEQRRRLYQIPLHEGSASQLAMILSIRSARYLTRSQKEMVASDFSGFQIKAALGTQSAVLSPEKTAAFEALLDKWQKPFENSVHSKAWLKLEPVEKPKYRVPAFVDKHHFAAFGTNYRL